MKEIVRGQNVVTSFAEITLICYQMALLVELTESALVDG
jgi:hypothetical protein